MKKFIKNHFYKLKKELPIEDMLAATTYNYNRFTVGNIYQAHDDDLIYDNYGLFFKITEEDILCFEEVYIGLTKGTRNFIDKNTTLGRMSFRFHFFGSIVSFTIYYNDKYAATVCLIGTIENINQLVHNTYRELKKNIIHKMIKLEIK